MDGYNIESEIEITTKTSILHHFIQAIIGGGNDTYIHFDIDETANSGEFAFLKYPQQLGLEL